MALISKILVPLDLGPHSERTLAYARELAQSSSATVDVIHVCNPPHAFHADLMVVAEPDGTRVTLSERLREEACERLQQSMDAWRREGLPLESAEVLLGNPAAVIVERAEQRGYDLIVIGTSGHSGAARFFIGSVAEKVVRHAPCAVLTVRS